MNAKRVAPGIYRYHDGTLYERPRLAGKRTWRKLFSRTLAQAKQEIAARRSDHHRAHLGLAHDPYQPSPDLPTLLAHYARAGFPDARGRPRAPRTALDESRRLDRLQKAFHGLKARDLSHARLTRFAHTRPPRAADLDLYTLRNAIKHALRTGQLKQDPVPTWPRFHVGAATRHCRDAAPASGTELHQLAHHLLQHPSTEPLAWWLLLLALTGCRRSEILELQMKPQAQQPGCIEGDWLWLQRRKGGTNPFAMIHPALRDCIEAHHRWHQTRFAGHPYWIPHRLDKAAPAHPDALGKALNRAAATLHLAHRHPHGLRAFYVTVRRSQGISDAQIAAEIGDASGAQIIAQVYGAVPPNWRGKAELTWLPAAGNPAWFPWLSPKLSPKDIPSETIISP
jgi:integrase